MNAAKQWMDMQQWKPFPFQKETWKEIAKGNSGLLNAPTGFGKTFAIWFGVVQHFIDHKVSTEKLHCLWITPLRALSKEIENATNKVCKDLELPYRVALRTGDTTASERAKQKRKSPEALITTPESVHMLLSHKNHADYFKNLEFVIVDEWHELLGTKRGVQIELALSRLKSINPNIKIWGISATIGNLEQAKEILLGTNNHGVLVKADIEKKIAVETVLPDVIEKFPWAGHLGLHLADKVLKIIDENNSTLIFTNTRFMAEMWFKTLLDMNPDLAGIIAIHHGSLSEDTRHWVENAIHSGILKAVVCTSSLDLGVDFRPVDTVIQIGSPKGIARFVQRAGRSGHQPGATSRIYFIPTHSLEIVEGSAMRYAILHKKMENRIPYIRSFDVLIQYLVTLAVGDGFDAQKIFKEISQTFSYQSLSEEEFAWCINFITTGGQSLYAYDEYHKVVKEDGLYKVTTKRLAMLHRLSMGTIVSGSSMIVKSMKGKKIGTIEETFISKLKPGDIFFFAGKNLQLMMVKYMDAFVKPVRSKKSLVPSWDGSKMPLSTQLSASIRHQINQYSTHQKLDRELSALKPLFEEQKRRSILPAENELLIEKINTKEGCHVFVYAFEGRYVHEGMAAIMANRIALFKPISFSIAMNDYGFELLSDQDIPIEDAVDSNLFSSMHLNDDVMTSVNTTEMAKRRFRDIATIAGLVFTGYPGKQVKTKHLQASSQLFFKVFSEYEPENLLLKQAYEEVFDFELEIIRLRNAFERIEKQTIVIQYPKRPTPFAFPIFTERWRDKYTNEELEDRVMKIKAQIEKDRTA